MDTRKVLASEIVGGKYFSGSKESMKPSYVVTSFGQKISRINVIGTVTEKFVSEDGRYAAVVIDDGSGAVRVKNFGEGVKMIESVEFGDCIVVVGKVREYNGEIYVNGDIMKKLDSTNYENLRKLEVLEKLIDGKRIAEQIRVLANQMPESEFKTYVKNSFGFDEESLKTILESKSAEKDYKPAVMSIIEKLDSGNGVEVRKIFEATNIEENKVERAISELLESGDLFEPTVGILKKV